MTTSEWAAWIQAAGSLLALAVALGIYVGQALLDRRARRRRLAALVDLGDRIKEVMDEVTPEFELDRNTLRHTGLWDGAADGPHKILNDVNLLDVGDAEVFVALYDFRNAVTGWRAAVDTARKEVKSDGQPYDETIEVGKAAHKRAVKHLARLRQAVKAMR